MRDDAIRLLTWALEELGVACAVLDPQLAIVEATPMADALTDGALVRGFRSAAPMRSRSTCASSPPRISRCAAPSSTIAAADLMYRLRVVPIFLPPLVARRGDPELLTDKLIDQLTEQGERRITQVSRAARDAIAGYPWPGNVRELRNALQYVFVIGDGPILFDVELPPEVSGMAFDPEATAVNMRPIAPSEDESPETRRIRLALEHADGNRERAAQSSGCHA